MIILQNQKREAVSTDLRNIILMMENLFELLKAEYQEIVISNLKLAYGFDKLKKFSKLLNNQPLEHPL